MNAIAAGDLIVLLGPDGERHILQAGSGARRVPSLGVVDFGLFVGRPWGSRHSIGLKEYTLLRPVLSDYVASIERRAQIITPKDAARILFETGLGSGGRCVEAGVGSGALTTVLAHAVHPGGKVYAYEERPEHLEVGRRNLERTPWKSCVEFRAGDVHEGVPETGLDAFILDLPDPERGVGVAARALRPGGVFVAYTPHVTQAQAVSTRLAEAGFSDVRTLETLERAWVLTNQGARPEFEMLGHTAFLTFARARGT